ncbi:hypothetical protein [Bacteroides caecimuris]|uniref:hypothetical protein n=1 Tax=Bacteroides caecimuris TaxID=1796613 RepID=UPI0026EBB3E4|nr:hypothetical protein [Bacteroides caecimuris]
MASPPSGKEGCPKDGVVGKQGSSYLIIDERLTYSPTTSPYGDSPPPTPPLSGESNLPEGGE